MCDMLSGFGMSLEASLSMSMGRESNLMELRGCEWAVRSNRGGNDNVRDALAGVRPLSTPT
jgi:hypothetical protein